MLEHFSVIIPNEYFKSSKKSYLIFQKSDFDFKKSIFLNFKKNNHYSFNPGYSNVKIRIRSVQKVKKKSFTIGKKLLVLARMSVGSLGESSNISISYLDLMNFWQIISLLHHKPLSD